MDLHLKFSCIDFEAMSVLPTLRGTVFAGLIVAGMCSAPRFAVAAQPSVDAEPEGDVEALLMGGDPTYQSAEASEPKEPSKPKRKKLELGGPFAFNLFGAAVSPIPIDGSDPEGPLFLPGLALGGRFGKNMIVARGFFQFAIFDPFGVGAGLLYDRETIGEKVKLVVQVDLGWTNDGFTRKDAESNGDRAYFGAGVGVRVNRVTFVAKPWFSAKLSGGGETFTVNPYLGLEVAIF